MGLPRQHTIDGDIEYILLADKAWDMDRIGEELDLLSEDEKILHPVMLYNIGKTRYDLDPVRGYLKDDPKPTIFRLKRLDRKRWAEARVLMRRDEREVAQEESWRHGLAWVDDPELELEGSKLRDKRLTKNDLDKIAEQFGDYMCEVGEAVLRASAPLGEDEKKSFVSLSTELAQTLETRMSPSQSSTVDETA